MSACFRVLWAALVGALLVPAFGLPEPLSGQWEGELSLYPRFALHQATLTLEVPLGAWTLKSESEIEQGLFSDQTFQLAGFALDYRLTLEGKAAFSPQGKVLKHLYRTIEDERFPQLLWQVPGPHWRYGWIKGELPLASGELWAKAYHRSNSASEIDYFMFTEAYRWEGGRWRPLAVTSAGVRERAFVAGRVRLKAFVDGRWRSRTEYNLRVLFQPKEAFEPFALAPEALAYLDAKYPDGWLLREPIEPELVKVYVWYSHFEEYTLGWNSEPWPGRTLELSGVFSGEGGKTSFAELCLEGEGWPLFGGVGEFELSLGEGISLGGTLAGLPGLAGMRFDISLELSPSGLVLSCTPSLSVSGGCVSLYAGATGKGGVSELSLYGVGAKGHLVATKWQVLLVFERPPSPRPSWYTDADFKRIAATGEYEDGLLVLARRGYGPSERWELSLCMYLGPVEEALFSLTRLLVTLELSLGKEASFELSWESSDPESPEGSPSLTTAWEVEF
ncbi:MAG: hypothetical protein XD60_0744 [Acetothermia bacterium 64_32]|nr:MAG: hypothetical protein XD60_0744 [Acetothermia bacterium 64_32]HAF70606.1 hypothetical protein [Candidatus Acetothermia bacterium]